MPYVTKVVDNKCNMVIVPETNVNLLRGIKKAQKAIWWMSVDNYFKTLKSPKYRIWDLLGLFRYNIANKDILHFAQSYYAIDFLKKEGVSENKIFYLSDYLDEEFISNSAKYEKLKKKDIVLYNPKKGWEFTKNLIEQSHDIEWCALQNMTPAEMREKMGYSKVYIDFGNHPGKDRIPREAAVMGCCVITGQRGAAQNKKDVFIPDKYKFKDDKASIPFILKMIEECFANYEDQIRDFEEYRKKIRNEYNTFHQDVVNIFKLL